ncbi:hypothetical protein PENSPDRAFT_652745 [Peniophora sp. CONT]|nr:hypothetical protein PENSPDRAFT_652745 [Peniophora sp. CONT]
MADRDTSNLCVEIIRQHFGPLNAKVAEVLLHRGRLSLTHLVRFTGLKHRTVRACILVLVQQNVLWHATEEDVEVFEVNTDECLARSRFGTYVHLVEELYGQEAARIVTVVLEHGKLRPPDIMQLLSADTKSQMAYAQALHKLVSAAYLKPATLLSHKSPRDKIIEYEKEEKAKLMGIPAAKELRQARELAELRFRREEEAAERIGMKRKATDVGGKASKRSKHSDEPVDVVDDDVYFRVNHDKFNVHIRNKIIVNAARERFNDGAAQVMQAALKAIQDKSRTVKDPRSDPMSVSDIIRHITDEEALASGLIMPSKKPKTPDIIQQYLHMLALHDNATPTGLSQRFIALLNKKVQVEFDAIGARLRTRVLEAVTRERHGSAGVRVLRLLLETGKMDEKQIAKTAMMSAKDVRPLLGAMSAESLVSLQEVPRTSDRNPTRTFYLWFVDLPKAYSVLLANLYKSLYNINTRLRTEQEEPLIKAVLAKLDREDVTEDDLTRVDRELLATWRDKRMKLTLLAARVEESVFILHDMAERSEE